MQIPVKQRPVSFTRGCAPRTRANLAPSQLVPRFPVEKVQNLLLNMIAATQSNHPLSGVTKPGDTPLEVACARLRQARMRVTKPRIAIIEALLKRDEPIAIDQLHQELQRRQCDLVTVYRCLAAFEDIGIVRRSFLHNGTSLYELTFGAQPKHYHVVCKACGRAERVDYFPVDGPERMLAERGYTQVTHIVEFFGLCPACGKKHTRNAAPAIPAIRL